MLHPLIGPEIVWLVPESMPLLHPVIGPEMVWLVPELMPYPLSAVVVLRISQPNTPLAPGASA